MSAEAVLSPSAVDAFPHRAPGVYGQMRALVQDNLPRGAKLITHGRELASKVAFPTQTLPQLDHQGFWHNLITGEEDTAFLLNGGGMSGVVTAAGLTELHKRGLTEKVKAYAGVSVGAINGAYLLGYKHGDSDSSIYWNTFATTDFIKPGWKPGTLSLDFLRDTLLRDIEPGKIRDHSSTLHVGITRMDGEGELHNTRNFNDKDMIELFVASAAAPYVSTGLVKLQEQSYTDGNLNGLPIKLFIEKGYKNIGVFMNHPLCRLRAPFKEHVALNINMRGRDHAKVRRATLNRHRKYQTSISALETPGVTAAIFAPREHVVDLLTTDQAALKLGAQYGRDAVVYDYEQHAKSLPAAA